MEANGATFPLPLRRNTQCRGSADKTYTMKGYLGEEVVKVSDTEFSEYTKEDWALFIIERWGQFDGAHHKQWCLDQISRILHGCHIEVKLARWDNGHQEYRFQVGDETQEYKDWVAEMKDGEDGPDTYDYDFGTPP